VCGDILRSLYFAQRLFGIAADAIIVNLAELDLTFRVDDKSTA